MKKKYITLYHGTDARILSMSKEERLSYLADVDLALEYLWTIWEPICHKTVIKELRYPNGEFMGTLPISYLESIKQRFIDAGEDTLYNGLRSRVSMADWSKQGAPRYQYGALYVTGSQWKASIYARDSYAGGERGIIVYFMLKGATFLGIPLGNPDSKTYQAIQRVRSFAEAKEQEPVVVVLNDVAPEDLLSESGEPVKEPIILGDSYRYIKDVDLSLYPVEHI